MENNRISEIEKFTNSLKYEGYKGISYVTFKLFPEGNKTKLKLTHTGLASFPVDEVPEFKRENFVNGWNHIIGKSLTEFFEQK